MTELNPSPEKDVALKQTEMAGSNQAHPSVAQGAAKNYHGNDRAGLLGGRTKTNQLSRLVETYREAKETLSPDEFAQLELRVTHEGIMPLQRYFCHIGRASYETRNRVIFGGATFVEWYGKGFKLKFDDRIDKKITFLYVSSAQMVAYRFRKYFKEILSDNTVAYFTVFAIGRLEENAKRTAVNLIVDDLRHLDLVRGKSKTAITKKDGSLQTPPDNIG